MSPSVSAISILKATPEHSPFLASATLIASRSHLARGPFDIALGLQEGDVLDILEWMTLSEFVCNCHFSKFLVAECNGQPVGTLSAYDPGEDGLQSLGAAMLDAYSGLGHDEAGLGRTLARLETVRRCFPAEQPATWIVEWVAVDPAFRRQAVCSRLLREVLALGAQRSLCRAQVSTYLGNQAAVSAYEKAGFRIDREHRDAQFEALLGPAGMVTLVRELP